MSTHSAPTAPPAASARPARPVASSAPLRAGRPRALQGIVLAALGLLGGALLVWQLGPVDLVTGVADAAPAGTLST